MQTAILTPSQSRDAREQLALSQGRVAADTRISRTYLSQFECEKLVLGNLDQQTLRDFYEARGAEFDDVPDDDLGLAGPNGPRVRDGLQVPDGVSREAADAILDEMADNDRRTRALLTADAPRGFLGVDSSEARESARKAVRLMAQNWALLQSLHGRGVVADDDRAEISVLELAMRDDDLRESLHVHAVEDRDDADERRAAERKGRRFLRQTGSA